MAKDDLKVRRPRTPEEIAELMSNKELFPDKVAIGRITPKKVPASQAKGARSKKK